VTGQRHSPAALYPRERPGTHCTGGWVGPRAGLDICGKSRPNRDSIPGPSSPYPVAIPIMLPGPQILVWGRWISRGNVYEDCLLGCGVLQLGRYLQDSHHTTPHHTTPHHTTHHITSHHTSHTTPHITHHTSHHTTPHHTTDDSSIILFFYSNRIWIWGVHYISGGVNSKS
jgi:hypothetical protein